MASNANQNLSEEEPHMRKRKTFTSENKDQSEVDDVKSQSDCNSVPPEHVSYNSTAYSEVSPNIVHYKNPGDYTQAMQQWMWQYQCWNSMNYYYLTMPSYMMGYLAMQQQHMMHTQAHNSNTNSTLGVGSQSLNGRLTDAQRQHNVHGTQTNQQNGPVELKIPPIWKRIVAELLDFIMLFVMKFIVTLICFEPFNIIDIEKYDLENFLSAELDYETAISITTELLVMEIINKVFVCMFEAMCLRYGLGGQVGGCTPGKRMMGIKVVSCDQIQQTPNNPNTVLVTPAKDIGMKNALIRAVIKNFSMAFFMPVFLTCFFFQHNRTCYDIAANCVCVQMTDGDLELMRQRQRQRRRR